VPAYTLHGIFCLFLFLAVERRVWIFARGMGNPAGLLMDEFATSVEDHKNGASIVQEFRTSGIPFGQSGRMGNTTGAAIFNASFHTSDGSSKIYDSDSLQELRKHYEDVDEYPDFSQVCLCLYTFSYLLVCSRILRQCGQKEIC